MRRVVPTEPCRPTFEPSSGTHLLLPLPHCDNLHCRHNIRPIVTDASDTCRHHPTCARTLNNIDRSSIFDARNLAVDLHSDRMQKTTVDVSCHNDSLRPHRPRKSVESVDVSFERVTQNILNASATDPGETNLPAAHNRYDGYCSDGSYDEHSQLQFNPRNKAYNQELAHLAYKKIEKRLIETIASEVARHKPKRSNDQTVRPDDLHPYSNRNITSANMKAHSNVDHYDTNGPTGSSAPKINVFGPTININVGGLFPTLKFAKRAKKNLNRKNTDYRRSLARINEASQESCCDCGSAERRPPPLSHPIYKTSAARVGLPCHNLTISVIQNNRFCNQSVYARSDCGCGESAAQKSNAREVSDIDFGVESNNRRGPEDGVSCTLGRGNAGAKMIPANVIWKKLKLVDTICQHLRFVHRSPNRDEGVS